jgi:hypothetical protein
MLFKIKTNIRRAFIGRLHINRPTSYPFISGDGFRSLAQHRFDDLSNIRPEDVEKNDIIFVRTDFLKEFFEEKHAYIKNPYILVSHNADTEITKEYKKYIDDKIIHWFAQNVLLKHEKLTPIPIGVTNYHYVKTIGRGKIYDLQKNIVGKDTVEKISNKISFGFSYDPKCLTPRSLARMALEKQLLENKNFERIKTDTQSEYYKKLSHYYLTVSPEGSGVDCYRTWESMCLGVVPIVKRSIATEYFKSMNLPLFIVDDWSELKNLDVNSLSTKYNELKNGFDNPAIYMGYWMDLIVSKRLK